MVADTIQNQESGKAAQDRRSVAPRTDIYETDAAYAIVADVPGVSEKDLEVSVDKGVLRVGGKTAHAPSGYKLLYAEYGEADFELRFELNDRVAAEDIAAELKDGVLTVTLPKRQEAVARQIEVKGA